MSRSSKKSQAQVGPFPPLFARLVRAAQVGCPEGYAGALAAYGALALVTVPLDGVLPDTLLKSTGDEQYKRIRSIADRYFGIEKVNRRLVAAVEGLNSSTFEERDAISTAYVKLLSISDTMHTLYGLSLGVILAELGVADDPGGVR